MRTHRVFVVVEAVARDRIGRLLAPTGGEAPVIATPLAAGPLDEITHYVAVLPVTDELADALEIHFPLRYSTTWWARRGRGPTGAAAHAFDAACPRLGWAIDEALDILSLRRVPAEPSDTTTTHT